MAKAKKPASEDKTKTEASGAAPVKAEPATPAKADTPASKAKTADTKPATSAAAAKKEAAVSKTTTGKSDTPAKADPPKAKTSTAGAAATAKEEPVKDKPASKPEAVSKAPEAKKEPANPAAQTSSIPKTQSAPKPTAPAPTPAPQKKQSGFWPLVFGGVIAAALGFLVSEMNFLGSREDTTAVRDAMAAQESLVAEQQAQIEGLSEQIAGLENAPAAEAVAPDLSGIETELAEISEKLTALQIRVDGIEANGGGGGTDPAIAQSYAEELARLQASVEGQKSEIQSLLSDAKTVEEATAGMAQSAAQRAALAQVTAALTNGEPYGDAIAALNESGVDDVPEALKDPAADGVVTLLNLQTRFAATARAGLASARAAGAQEGEQGFGGFLRRQLGARSVAPREGNDPDAVLSRAEAAVRDGKLADALGELDTLPADVQSAMQDWLDDARTRAAAQAAATALTQRLTTN